MNKKIGIAFIYCCFFSNFSLGATGKELCGDEEAYIITGSSNVSSRDATAKADAEILEAIAKATIKSISKDKLQQKTDGGAIESEENITIQESEVIKSLDSNIIILPFGNPYEESGIWFSKRYICPSNVAMPYLKSLKDINDSLSVFSEVSKPFCDDFKLNYKPRIREYRYILKSLGQIDKVRIEHYNRLKTKCDNYQTNEPEKTPESKNTNIKLGVSIGVLGLGAIAYGYKSNLDIKDLVKNRNFSKAKKEEKTRNILYGAGGILLASGIVLIVAF